MPAVARTAAHRSRTGSPRHDQSVQASEVLGN
jgi:hypothetical protein